VIMSCDDVSLKSTLDQVFKEGTCIHRDSRQVCPNLKGHTDSGSKDGGTGLQQRQHDTVKEPKDRKDKIALRHFARPQRSILLKTDLHVL
jgi:hypothetical protein